MKLLNARKKLVTLAVATAAAAGAMVSAPAQALNVSQNNVGEVLLFPYYTVKNGFDTVFSVTNTTNRTAVFKIRFREALNSREVLDFNVVLSPYDWWGGAVTKNASGTGGLVRTADKSCTSPNKEKWNVGPVYDGVQYYDAPLFTDLFSNQYADGATTDSTRVQEGYFEVILMGVSGASTSASTTLNVIEYNAKHVGGTPRNCALVDAALATATSIANNDEYFSAPENILKGHVTYIDVSTGKAIDAEPAAIEDWRSTSHIIAPANDVNPTLASGDPNNTILGISDGSGYSATANTAVNGISAILSADNVINEYATGGNSVTSWVLTFPTKHFYTDSYTASGTSTTAPSVFEPFANRFITDTDSSGPDATGMSCDTIQMSYVNREEGPESVDTGTGFSGRGTTTTPPVAMCYEANVLNFNGKNVFGTATNHLAVTTGNETAGWASVNLAIAETGLSAGNTGTTVPGISQGQGVTSFGGLPVIGFAAIMRSTATVGTNYGSSEQHTIVSGAN